MIAWMCGLFASYMVFAAGRAAEGKTALREVIAFGTRHGYRAFIFWPRQAIAALCARALTLGIVADYVRALIVHYRFTPLPEADDTWPLPPSIRVPGPASGCCATA